MAGRGKRTANLLFDMGSVKARRILSFPDPNRASGGGFGGFQPGDLRFFEIRDFRSKRDFPGLAAARVQQDSSR
jgi:hypothetical protein